MAGSPLAYANPVGGQVVGGGANISTSGNTLTVQQTTNKAIINWNSFDIAPGEITQFQQPSSSSIALNRVTGSQNPSQILGQLSANGQVWIINPNGVMFGGNTQVNVAGLVATTANISDSNFMAGHYTFDQPGNPNATINNAGTITATEAGLVAFVAPNVTNTGLIQAKLGKVQLASGDGFTLDLYGDGLINLQASPAVTSQLVANSGTIRASGGTVTLTAAAAQDTVNSLINNSGVIEADSIGQQNGEIVLSAAGGMVTNSGEIDARGQNPGESGGTVSISAATVQQAGTVDVSGRAQGGSVNVSFAQSYSDTAGSSVTANGGQGAGGSINVIGTEPGSELAASGSYQATSAFGQGGSIDFFADHIAVRKAAFDVSGESGGRLTLGFDLATGRESTDLQVDQNTTLVANGTQGQGGSIDIAGGTVTMAGQASAQGLSRGGSINVRFDTLYSDTANALLTVASSGGQGGVIHVEGGADTGTLTASGTYVTDGQTTGGQIDLLASDQILLLGAYLSSRGLGGGGNIRVGGDFHGGTTRRSKYTGIDGSTLILADATDTGNGGSVAVWSDVLTRFAGTISAKGGPNGGDGGFVETSGHDLVATGLVIASAPHGTGGMWLLDPNNVTIATGSDTATPAYTNNWTAASNGNLQPSDITGSLNAGTSVSITASGTIDINSAIAAANNSNATLTISAGSTLTLAAPISTSGSGTLGVSLTGSSIVLNYAGTAISSNGGNISLTGPVTLSAATTLTSGGGGISFSSTVNGAQALTLNNGAGTITQGGIIGGSTALSSITVNGSGAWTVASAVTTGAIDFTNYTGTLTRNAGLTVNGNVTLGAGMTLAGASGLTVGATGTLTSNGKTWGNAITLGGANGTVSTYTLADAWTVGSLSTGTGGSGQVTTINGSSLTILGNLSSNTGGNNIVSGTTNLILGGTGTWSSNGTTIKNNLAVNTAGTITISGSVSYGSSTLTYTAGTVTTTGSTLNISGATTLNTNGVTWNNVAFDELAPITATLASNLNITGNLTLNNHNGSGNQFTLNGSTIYAGGNLTLLNSGNGGGTIGGTTNIVLNGTGTWSTSQSTPALQNNLTINTAGTITISGNVYYNTGTLTYTAGTVTTTGSTLNVGASTTLNTNGMSWNNVALTGGTVTYTLNSNMTLTGNLTYGSGGGSTTTTMNGSTMYVGGNLTIGSGGNSAVLTGTTGIVLNGTGTWSQNSTNLTSLRNNLTINTAGTITVSGSVGYDTGTFTYTAGTVNAAGSTVTSATATALPTSITWNNLSLGSSASGAINLPGYTLTGALTLNKAGGVAITYTLLGDVHAGGDLTINNGTNQTLTLNNNTIYVGGSLSTVNGSGNGADNGTTGIVLNGTGTWTGGSNHALQNNLTFNTAGTITVSGNVYYDTGTLTYTAGTITTAGSTLNVAANTTFNTNGMSWNNVTLNGSPATYTLSSDMTVGGALKFNNASSTDTVNGHTIYVAGDLTIGTANATTVNGTTNIVLNGTGTWSQFNSSSLLKNNLTINTAGTITVSGSVFYNTGTLAYLAGTVTTAGSTLDVSASATLDANGITWNNVTLNGTGAVYTLSSDMAVTASDLCKDTVGRKSA